jgi:ATP-dependent Clp endopeptidase proteolytic subunit ClpP
MAAKKNITKASAEAEKIMAEADLAKAQARQAKAEARKAEAEASQQEIKLEDARKDQLKQKATDEENYLYRFNKDVNSHSVAACMSKLTEWARLSPGCDVEIIFSSPGGSIIDGFELFDFIQELRGRGHKMTTGSLGMAASMAGILLQAGNVRWIGHQAWMMIHRAAFGAIGKTYEIEDEVKLVKRIEERCVDIFVSRSKLTKYKIKRNWDRKDWWIDADECLELGLVDEVRAIMPEHEKVPSRELKKRSTTKKKKRR